LPVLFRETGETTGTFETLFTPKNAQNTLKNAVITLVFKRFLAKKRPFYLKKCPKNIVFHPFFAAF